MFLDYSKYEKTMAVKPVQEKTLQQIYDSIVRKMWAYRIPVVRIDYPVSTPAEPAEYTVDAVFFNSDGRVSPALAMLEHEDFRNLRKSVGYDVLQYAFYKENGEDDEWPVLMADRDVIQAMCCYRRGENLTPSTHFGSILHSYGPAYVSHLNLYMDALARRGVCSSDALDLVFKLEACHMEWRDEYMRSDFETQTKVGISEYYQRRRFERAFYDAGDPWCLKKDVIRSIMGVNP